jgi:hypothetical protein
MKFNRFSSNKENLEKGIYDVIADVIIAGHGTVDTTTGKRGLGWAIRGHLRVEDDDANSPVQRTTTDNDERRPATRFNGGTVRLDGGDGAPVVFGGCEGADGVPLLRAHPTAATDGSGDGYRGRATRPEDRRQRRRLYGRRGSSGLGANGRGRLGDAIYRLVLKRSDSNREKSSREKLGLVWRDKLKTNSIWFIRANLISETLGERKRIRRR